MLRLATLLQAAKDAKMRRDWCSSKRVTLIGIGVVLLSLVCCMRLLSGFDKGAAFVGTVNPKHKQIFLCQMREAADVNVLLHANSFSREEQA